MTHSTPSIYGYTARSFQIAREEARCRHYMGYCFQLTAMDLLYESSNRQDSTYHGLCYTRHGALAQWVHDEGSI